jgi:mono/diheme cytochrome c family protein
MRWLIRAAVVLAVVCTGYFAYAWRTSLPPAVPPTRASLDPALLLQGAELAAVGNCAGCHTAEGGRRNAGGRAVQTPFGAVWATNITPDIETGIGAYSKAAFVRAVREGVDRQGRHLYPAFPYDHMAKTTEADAVAVWAYLMTREPVSAVPPKTALPFPFNIRLTLAGWKALFLDRKPLAPNPAKSAEWNRGAYLVEGLAHCGACHTPRNALGAEKSGAAYAGGQADGWTAPALNAASPAAVPWTAERLADYLGRGRSAQHGASAGPMLEVTHALADVPASDIRAMAIYVADLAGNATAERVAVGSQALLRPKLAAATQATSVGASLYAGACAQCHGESGRAPLNPAINLALSTAVRGTDAANVLSVIRDGIHQLPGVKGSMMPGFGDVLSDAQIREVAAYVRATFTDKPAWPRLDTGDRK